MGFAFEYENNRNNMILFDIALYDDDSRRAHALAYTLQDRQMVDGYTVDPGEITVAPNTENKTR